ncbi:tumor necrosis factor receptor superfamily member 3 isoform X1 [Anguilla anguilla]|uniref:tumor necrosis factor receptor superfamily member 3 isoform X1 n=1 Tax=Anguilla anguilla TaxID=7936 RepID=UPI0015AE8AC1|nr:tumor necrosis factor receptor superfamily member 3 isoform X1 [Anguilla anguilla]
MEMKLLCLEMLMLLASMTSALPTEGYYTDYGGRRCRWCPPGQYQADCNECSPCPSGSFTSKWNREDMCHPCNLDCRKDFHLQVVQPCSAVSDAVCKCIDGFACRAFDSTTGQCSQCDVDVLSTLPPALTKHQTETTCAPGNCDLQTHSVSPTETALRGPDTGDRALWWCVGLVVVFLVILLLTPAVFMWRRREGTCLKEFFKLCSVGGHKGENEVTADQPCAISGQLFSKEAHWNAESLTNPNRENHADQPISIDQASKVTGNLGPFHIYSAGSVFVSLLNHFANPEGKTEGGNTAQKEETPSPPSPTSPPIHLSEEERDAEKDCIFFPLQEQGKESHLSKEEEEICCQQKEK